MKRTVISLCATMIVTLLWAPAVGAVEFSVLGPTVLPFEELFPGNQITLDLLMTNVSQTEVLGLGASIYGYDENAFAFNSGSAVSTFFSAICVAPGSCFGGLPNIAGPSLSESSIGTNGNRIQFALTANLVPVTNTGVGIDQGLDGQVGTAMFSVTFDVVGFPTSTPKFLIGTGYQGDAVVLPGGILSDAPTLEITFTPEPGTALLLGLGLAGLSRAGARDHSHGGQQRAGSNA